MTHSSKLLALGRLKKSLAAAGFGAFLASCAGGPPPATFNLSAPQQGFSAARAHGVLVVSRPNATAPINGDRIVVRTGPATIAFLKGAQWVEDLPALVQDRLIDSFENAHLIDSVVRPSDNLSAKFDLVTDIRRFDIDAETGEAVVQITAKIADVSTGKIIAGKIFVGSAQGSASDGASATKALNQALEQALIEIVNWTAARA